MFRIVRIVKHFTELCFPRRRLAGYILNRFLMTLYLINIVSGAALDTFFDRDSFVEYVEVYFFIYIF